MMWCKSVSFFTLACLSALAVLCVQAGDPVPNTTTTTTPQPTTSTSPNPPTTLPPTTTPSPSPPTTSPAPVTSTVPPPSDKIGHWNVSENNVTCIMTQMVISTKISYPKSEANKNGTVELHVPSNAAASGSCANNSQSIVLMWNSNQNKLSITFGTNSTTKMYFIANISLQLFADNNTFPNISEKWIGQTLDLQSSSVEFKTNFNQSYRCSREQDLPLHLKDFPEAVLVLSQVQLQAFHNGSSTGFGEAQDCELDTPDIVPIAVGCALAALVLVVLVAYLIGRHRSQARGYLSM